MGRNEIARLRRVWRLPTQKRKKERDDFQKILSSKFKLKLYPGSQLASEQLCGWEHREGERERVTQKLRHSGVKYSASYASLLLWEDCFMTFVCADVLLIQKRVEQNVLLLLDERERETKIKIHGQARPGTICVKLTVPNIALKFSAK